MDDGASSCRYINLSLATMYANTHAAWVVDLRSSRLVPAFSPDRVSIVDGWFGCCSQVCKVRVFRATTYVLGCGDFDREGLQRLPLIFRSLLTPLERFLS